MTAPVVQHELLWSSDRRLAGARRLWGWSRREPLSAAAVVFLIVLAVVAIFASALAPYGALEIDPADRLQSPSVQHLFGTDEVGRDVLSRVMYGARVSLVVGVVSVVLSVVFGTVIGVVSAYAAGFFDLMVQRLLDALMAIPALILAITFASIFSVGSYGIILPVAIVFIPVTARVLRSEVFSLKERPFVEAARVIGCSPTRIVLRHIVPNLSGSLLVLSSVWVGNAVIIEASLSFLGMGTKLPNPSWGNMLSGGGRTYMEAAPWLAIFPGLAIVSMVLSLNILGDSLRDALDPKLRRR